MSDGLRGGGSVHKSANLNIAAFACWKFLRESDSQGAKKYATDSAKAPFGSRTKKSTPAIAKNGLRFHERTALIVRVQEIGAGYYATAPLPFGPNTPVVAACSLFFYSSTKHHQTITNSATRPCPVHCASRVSGCLNSRGGPGRLGAVTARRIIISNEPTSHGA